jgi:hypothetical protein
MLLPAIGVACGSSGSAPGSVDAGELGDDDTGSHGIADGGPMSDDDGQALDATSSDAPTDAPADSQPGPSDAGSFDCHRQVTTDTTSTVSEGERLVARNG